MNESPIFRPESQLIVPQNPVPTLAQAIEEAKVTLRQQALAAVGLGKDRYDAANLTDRDVKHLVAAQQKRRRKLAKRRIS